MKGFALFSLRAFDIKLHPHVLFRRGGLNILRYGMDTFQNPIYFLSNLYRVGPGNFVGVELQFQAKAPLEGSQKKQAQQNESGSESRGEVESASDSHPHRSDHEQR